MIRDTLAKDAVRLFLTKVVENIHYNQEDRFRAAELLINLLAIPTSTEKTP